MRARMPTKVDLTGKDIRVEASCGGAAAGLRVVEIREKRLWTMVLEHHVPRRFFRPFGLDQFLLLPRAYAVGFILTRLRG
jgi:hypothetical protein